MPVTPDMHAYMQIRVTGLALYWECSRPSDSSNLNQNLPLKIPTFQHTVNFNYFCQTHNEQQKKVSTDSKLAKCNKDT